MARFTAPKGDKGDTGSVSAVGNIIPDADNVYDLGSEDFRWHHLFVGPDSITMVDTESGIDVVLSTQGGALLIDGAELIRVGNMGFTATGIASDIGSQDITVGAVGDTGYLSTARGIKFPDGTVQNTAAETMDVGIEQPFAIVSGTTGTQPTFSGTPLFSGAYIKTGAQVHFQMQGAFTNITSFGTGQYYVDLPLPAKYAYQFTAGCVHDISTTKDYIVSGHVFAGQSRVYLKSVDATGNSVFDVPFTATSPFTLATADNFHISGDYITTAS